MDFDERIDILPVADPNIFSMSQRITLAQTQLQLATSNPQYAQYVCKHTDLCTKLLGVKRRRSSYYHHLLRVQPMDPSMEHISALTV